MTNLALKNAQFVIILVLISILIGVRSFESMPRSEDPQTTFPIFLVTAVYPGTSPEDMETLIVDPIEEVLKEIDDLEEIKSEIQQGVAVISMEGSFDKDFTEQYDEVIREVNTVRGDLPDNLALFEIRQVSPADVVNIAIFALTGEHVPYKNLENLAEDFKSEIDDIEGLGDVDVEAFPKQEVRISLDFERMAAQNVNLGQVASILIGNNVNIPGGSVSAGEKSFNIQSTKGFEDLEAIRNTVVSGGDNRVVYLRDIAEVKLDYEDEFWTARYNKEKAVLIGVKLNDGYNILQIDKVLKEKTASFQAQLPPNVELNIAFEQAPAVKKRINDFFINLIQGILLVGLVILLALGWRSAFIIVVLIPLSIILALSLLNGAGFGLQQISVASLVLALGLLVDNGIVVLENINRFIKEGMDKKQAALEGTKEVSLAIIASTVTTLLSFFPLTQLGRGAGEFLRSLPLTVIFTLLISLLLALTFSPIMSKWVLSNKQSNKKSLADRAFDFLTEKLYRPALNFSIKKGWIIVLLAAGVFVFSVSLFPKIGVSFFPTADKPLLLIDINTPNGSSLENTKKAILYVEGLLDKLPEVQDYTSNLGHGAAQVYYNRIPVNYLKSHGQIVANLEDWDARRFYEIMGELRIAFNEYPGAEITIEELKNGAPVDAPIEVRVTGKRLDEIKKIAGIVEDSLRTMSGVININNPMKLPETQIQVKLDKAKAGLLFVSELDFDRTIRASLNGLIIDQVNTNDEDYNLVIRMPFDQQPSVTDFSKIYITNQIGGQIPLNHIADITFTNGVAQFGHFNLDRYVSVTGSLENLDNTIEKTLEFKEKLDAIDWPADVRYELGGEYEEQQATFGDLGIILTLAQVMIFAVLVLQFRSVLQPLIVFSAIPLAITGSFLALYITGWPFSFFAFVGLISLIGIVVNNSIILVDYINQLRAEGMALQEALVLGCLRRFKPIVLTTITTILGLVPLTLAETNQWSPLCWTIIGGMVSSSILTLVVVPVLYRWFTRE